MKQILLRKNNVKQTQLIKPDRRGQLKLTTGLSDQRLNELDKYIRNAERGRLPAVNDGADVTRPINDDQVRKFLECPTCQAKPAVFISYSWKMGKRSGDCVGVCSAHWETLASTVIGWSCSA